MKLEYTWQGERFVVLIVGDIIAVPFDAWSGNGYGVTITTEWLLHEGVFGKRPKARKLLLADLVVRALADAHGYQLGPSRTTSGIERFALRMRAKIATP